MHMIQPAPKQYNAKESEKEVQKLWNANKILDKVKEKHSRDQDWFFMDGPPYASGSIHLGTAWNKIIKDVIIRYRTMRGFNVRRQPGWDCHGLPIEVMVERKLNIQSKKDIENVIGIAEFINECRKWSVEHIDLMSRQFDRLGVWMDWDKPYLTFSEEFIEAAWWTLKLAHDKGLLRREMRVIQWCPRCETALAEHEVRGEYHNVRDPSLYARFKLVDHPNTYIVIWTTTPWTLPTNMAVSVHPDSHYAKVQVGEDTYIIAESLVSKVMEDVGIEKYKIMDIIAGRELEGWRYEHPMLEEVPKQGEFRDHHKIICGEHVTLEDGTGCVHTAPGHGQEDFEVGAKYGLPVFSPVGPDGKFTGDAGKYVGMFVKDSDSTVLNDLEAKHVLLKHGTIMHSYPHCWRCKTALIFRATDQWFLRVSDIKNQILEQNAADVTWYPKWVGTRYVNGVESVGDWCISRQRYWGIPIPIWVCANCGHEQMIGSRDELARFAQKDLHGVDLHRPRVDEIVIKCPHCDGEMRRTPDVLDVWFDSGIAPWASLGYPLSRENFERYWPADFITEGEDQVTKWFYSQQVASVVAFGSVPYKSVLMHGFALDEEGRKMSKSFGNVVDPLEVSDKHGADALRFYMLAASPVWEDLKFSLKELGVVDRMVNVLWNVYSFATTYMSLDGFDPKINDIEKLRGVLEPEDKWILSRVNTVIREVTKALEDYDLHVASRTIQKLLLEDISRWYVKLIRPRTWIEKDDPKKQAAYATLFHSLDILLRLLAPIMPHISETMYLGLVRAADPSKPESIHLDSWPEVDVNRIDEQIEKDMEIVQKIFECAATARQEAAVKLRWPVKMTYIKAASNEVKESALRLQEVLKSQLNTKELLIVGPNEDVEQLRPVPGLSQDGVKRFGEGTEPINNILRRMGFDRIQSELKHHKFVGMQVRGRPIQVNKEDIDFNSLSENLVMAKTDVGSVIVDKTSTLELEAERLARELVRRLQMMRKELDLGMEDRVDVIIGPEDEYGKKLVESQADYLQREVRIRELVIVPAKEVKAGGFSKDWEISDKKFKLVISQTE